MSNTLWVEKYRPATLENYIGNEQVKIKVADMIKTGDVPHLLFSGRAGGGKTTLAKILIKNIKCDYLFINASDENSVDVIRNKVRNFASTIGFNPIKLVVLDEADYISPNGQAALRNMMEAYSESTRFILTCNYQERIIDPLVSRTQAWTIVPPSQKEVAVHLANILKGEGVVFEPTDVKQLVVSYYPDIRKIINTAQLFSNDGLLKLDMTQLLDNDIKLHIMSILFSSESKIKRMKQIRELIHKNAIRDFSEIYQFLFENIEEFPETQQSRIILQIAESQYREAFVVDKEINFAALIINIIEAL